MADVQRVLLLEGTEDVHPLAERIHDLGVQPVRVAGLDEALRLLEAREPVFSAALVPVTWPAGSLKRDLRTLRRAGPAGSLPLVVYGKPADRVTRKQLRGAGVALALWQPFDDGTLRFQLNQAFDGGRSHEHRRADRVPTYLLARILSTAGGPARDTVIYSLSATGAFVETPRARMGGAEIELEIRLPGRPLVLRAEVVFTNMPGNLQRPNLALGMGVRFVDLDPEGERALRSYLDERRAALIV